MKQSIRDLDKRAEAANVPAVARGKFITLEGGEGAGKSTQIRLIAERLKAFFPEVVVSREPGGSPGAEAIRHIILNGEIERWSPISEALLMYAARRDHIERLIAPALARGAVVICDRFADSTRAYQGAGGGVPVALIDALEREVVGDTRPDLTLIFDMPVEAGLGRAAQRGGDEARFEAKGLAFHERMRAAFRQIAASDPRRCVLIDAEGSVEAVLERAWDVVRERLDL